MQKKRDGKSGAILEFVLGTKKLVLYKIMGLFGSKPTTTFRMKTDEQLWYEISENLTELSRRDAVDYRVRATRDSVKKKLEDLNLL